MPENSTPNVKVYDRPERTGPSPVMLVIIVLVVLTVGYFVYRSMHPAASASGGQPRTSAGMLPLGLTAPPSAMMMKYPQTCEWRHAARTMNLT